MKYQLIFKKNSLKVDNSTQDATFTQCFKKKSQLN